MADVVIVGAGIGGLCAARAVALAGHRPLLIERNQQVAIGAALGLWPNAIRALDRLGCGQAVLERSTAGRRMLICSADGRRLSETDVEAIARVSGAPTVMIERPELHRLLADGIGPPRIATVTGVDDLGVTLTDGVHVTAAATIGADGLGSIVRRYVAPGSRVVDVGYTVVRGLAAHGLEDGLVCEAWGRDELIGAAALSGGRTYWFYEARTECVNGDDPLAAVGGDRWPQPWPQIIAATDREALLVHAIRTVTPPRSWHRGRVALLGDAAHAMEPNLGQGAAQAIEDAVGLLGALRAHRDVPQALSAYAAGRQRRAAMVQRESGRMARLALNRHERARNLLVRATPELVRSLILKRLIGPREMV
jgi:2-polyprenyl-6-methoxyphenol hydroxylase-like FAD-dependent oxidoreductase